MNKFKGWNRVFAFTFRNGASGKGYLIVTIIIALLLLVAVALGTAYSAKPSKEDEGGEKKPSPVELVYVSNQTELPRLELKDWIAQQPEAERFAQIEWNAAEERTEKELAERAEASKNVNAMGILITETAEEISVRAVLPSTGELELKEGQEVAELVTAFLTQQRMEASGLTELQRKQLEKPVTIGIAEAGEAKDVFSYLIKYLAPLVFGLLLYFMLLLYGQTICQDVSTEKTSKLMETLLTSLHPYALLTGKVFGIVATALLQFFIWVAAGVAGLFGGIYLGKVFYPESTGTVETVWNFLRDSMGENALKPSACFLALLIFCCGFLFYSVLAGMAGSMVSRPEEASSVTSVFTFPILISWLVTYFGSLLENSTLMLVARFIPFTIPFGVPVELLMGSIGIVQGLISTAILLIFSVLVIMISARIYRGLVLYTGQKLSMSSLIGIIRNK